MKFFLVLIFLYLNFFKVSGENLEKCIWKNDSGTPCVTIFSTPNTSELNENSLGKPLLQNNKFYHLDTMM